MLSKIRPFDNGSIEVERLHSVEIDGATFTRPLSYVLVPDALLNPTKPNGDPWTIQDEPEEVQSFCAAWWTSARVAAWRAAVAAPVEDGEADEEEGGG